MVVGALIGYVLPSVAVGWLGRRRKSAIRRALPGSLDMLALSVEAGLSLDGAFSQVAHRWRTPLSEEFRSVLLEFQMGRDRRQALQDMGQRTGLSDVIRFTTAVVQADLLGVPLAGVLFEQAADIRLRRKQRAEDLARKAPVKMLFPMVVLIFPALFVVILGPAVPRLLAMFELAH
jgi:tight adherence protein C